VTRPLAFDTELETHEGNIFSVAVFHCSRCPATHRHRLPHGRKMNPEKVAQRCERDGWRTDKCSRGRVLCPGCLQEKHPRRLHAVTKIPATTPETKPAAAPPARPSADPKDATPEVRAKIRRMLDGHFDEGKGCYIDGYSDQKIGQELNIPWAIVANLREIGYGPIRVDPAVAALEAELAEARNQRNHISQIIMALDKRLADLSAKIEALATQRRAA